MERLTVLTATITEEDGREEREYCPSGKLIDIYIDEENQDIRNMLIKRELCNKLGQLEDIEEELGIDLIILLKAVKDGVWVKHPYSSIDYEPFRIDYWTDYKTGEEGMYICGMEIKNYGKTWALTKEELL